MTTKKQTYFQVLHKECGGEIVLVASNINRNDIGHACKKCSTIWSFENENHIFPFPIVHTLGDDMELFDPNISLSLEKPTSA